MILLPYAQGLCLHQMPDSHLWGAFVRDLNAQMAGNELARYRPEPALFHSSEEGEAMLKASGYISPADGFDVHAPWLLPTEALAQYRKTQGAK